MSYELFQTAINNNYKAAQEYYSQRRKMLNALFRNDEEKLFDNIIKYIDQRIAIYQTQVVSKIRDKIKLNDLTPIVHTQEMDDITFQLTQDILSQARAQSVIGKQLSSILGIGFEKFLEQSLAPEQLTAAVGAKASQIIDSLLDKGFERVGNTVSTSAVVKGQRQIRPDIGLNMGMNKSHGVAYLENDGAVVELQSLIDLSDFSDSSAEITSSDVLQAYLSTNSYGFSAKLWSNPSTKVFSHSSVLQEMIDAQLYTIGEHGQRTTWESTYAEWYVAYQLSKYLLNIIGPLNVAMITGNNFIWMDNFLNRKLFYMDIQVQNHFIKHGNRGPGYEVFPSIVNPAIKIKQLNNEMRQFTTALKRQTGTIHIRNRRITTKAT